MTVDLPATPSAHSLGAAIERLRHRWGWIFLFGLLLDIAGIIALGSTVFATIVAANIVGVMMIIAGVAELAMGFRARDWTHFFLWVIGGIIYVVAGVFVIINPLLASIVLTLLLGAGLLAAGIVRLYLAFQLPAGRPRGPIILAGIITALLGLVIIIGWPRNSFVVLGLLLAIDLMFHGIGWMIFAFWLRSVHRQVGVVK
jgi:uncharacterized membrane protein HdeD (DUF308 family)